MVDGVLPLESEIRRLMSIAGPMPVGHYMTLCLTHPEHGYYTTRDPFGTAGDFTTAPEISQMFGELVGLWIASVWRRMGSPAGVRLIELGPGRGTMMLDAMRAARVMPGLHDALSIHLVESSPALERRQRQTLGGLNLPLEWHRALPDVPDGPSIVVANEFFDALPVSQAVKKDGAWYERRIGIARDGNLAFMLAPEPMRHFTSTLPAAVRDAPNGAIYEWRPNHAILDLARRLVRGGGAALIIDYGHLVSSVGETFQAVRGHRFTSPLTSPGLVDLTAHVDFQALAVEAETMGARNHGPIEQAVFLTRMGIDTRCRALKAMVADHKAAEIEAARLRLTAGGVSGMGTAFKVLGISDPFLETLPAFDKIEKQS